MGEKIHIGLVEDQLLFREGMKALLSTWPTFEVIFECADGFSVLERLNESTVLPDVLLVDISLPSQDGVEFDGIAVTEAVIDSHPGIKVLILSVHNDESFIAELIERGAHGYLVKDCDPNEVHEAIVSVHEKGSYINQMTLVAIQRRMNQKTNKPKIGRSQEEPLSKREIEVLQFVCKQMTTDEIAEKLFISSKTVNGHRNNLLQKTGSRNVAGLVLYAIKRNLIEPVT